MPPLQNHAVSPSVDSDDLQRLIDGMHQSCSISSCVISIAKVELLIRHESDDAGNLSLWLCPAVVLVFDLF